MFRHHTIITIDKPLNVLGFIKRNTEMFSFVVHLRVFCFALVHYIPDYRTIVWRLPYLAKNVIRLERVRNKFLSRVASLFLISAISVPRQHVHVDSSYTFLSSRHDANLHYISSSLEVSLDAPLLFDITFRVFTSPESNSLPYLPRPVGIIILYVERSVERTI